MKTSHQQNKHLWNDFSSWKELYSHNVIYRVHLIWMHQSIIAWSHLNFIKNIICVRCLQTIYAFRSPFKAANNEESMNSLNELLSQTPNNTRRTKYLLTMRLRCYSGNLVSPLPLNCCLAIPLTLLLLESKWLFLLSAWDHYMTCCCLCS